MGAPLLIKREKDAYNTVILAKEEFKAGVLPISVNRPNPVKVE